MTPEKKSLNPNASSFTFSPVAPVWKPGQAFVPSATSAAVVPSPPPAVAQVNNTTASSVVDTNSKCSDSGPKPATVCI